MENRTTNNGYDEDDTQRLNEPYNGGRPKHRRSNSTGTRERSQNYNKSATCLPMARHILVNITEQRDPDQLIIALEARPGWWKLLSSKFSLAELDSILLACVKCARANSHQMLGGFIENVLTTGGQKGLGNDFVTRAASLLSSTTSIPVASSSARSMFSRPMYGSEHCSIHEDHNIICERRLIENVIIILEVAIWIRPAALAIPSKVLLSVIETHPRITHFKDSNADELTTRIAKIKENLDVTRNERARDTGRSGSNPEGPRLLRGYRISGAAPDSFRQMNILPTKKDLNEESPFLRKNITKGRYESVEDYLDIQFRLLREDFVTPLRLGLQQFRGLEGEINRHKLSSIQNVRFYMGVRLNKEFTDKSAVHGPNVVVLQLNMQELKRVNWERSKRFSYGSLVGVSRDHFENVVFVTVVARDIELLKRGIIQFELCDAEEVSYFKAGTEYSLIESSGAYFEAYRHNLAVLQTISADEFPFARNLVFVEKDVHAPSYMQHIKTLNVSPILRNELKLSKFAEEFLGWPSEEETCLNAAQFKSVASTFDREVCIIQGPPGTGKTFIGLKIVEMLLLNKVTDKPLLIVCFTNHALDQFLKGILQFTQNIVRIGGRCQDEAIEHYNLRVLRQHTSKPSSSSPSEKDIRQLRWRCKANCHGLNEDLQNTELLLNQLLGRATFDLKLRTIGQWDNFIELNKVVTESMRRIAEEEEDIEENEGGYMSDEDRGEIGDEQEADTNLIGIFNNAQEHAVYAFLGSWHQRHKHMENLPFAVFKLENLIQKIENHQPTTPRDLELSLNERWLLYRQQHWKEARAKISSYLQTCETSQTASGIYVTRSTLNNLRNVNREEMTEDEQIDVVIRCLRARLLELRRQLSEETKQMIALDLELDLEIIRSKHVIAITTTGAAKYNRVLQRVGCEVTIIEEAAEILEGHLITALNPKTKQLILIGDHQQLQPSTVVHALAHDFRMQVSLFERLLTNGLPYVRLQEQHRMRDQFLHLLVPTFYDDYFSHASVFNYDHVRGLTRDLCFITHTEGEDCEGDTHSKSNKFEARFVTRLAFYLRTQGYESADITILTTYSGQVFAIQNEIRIMNSQMGYTSMRNVVHRMGRKQFTERIAVDGSKPVSLLEGVRVTTVDNYQGEESEVVIASFVRSNDDGKIGFLARDNRICVALSRARKGFYCVGNLAMLAEGSNTWKTLLAKLLDMDCVKKGIELYCERHDRKIVASQPEEFAFFSDGGCDKPCETRLECGHVCPLNCHKIDADHKLYRCEKPCVRLRNECSHPCVLKCHESCGLCLVLVMKELPCKHKTKAACSKSLESICCDTKVDKVLACGHVTKATCCTPVSAIKCEKACTRTLGCEHACPKKCHERCSKCMEFVTAKSPCGHEVRIVCRDKDDLQSLQRACEKEVSLTLACGHEKKVKCFDRMSVNMRSLKCTQLKDVECAFNHKLKVNCEVLAPSIDEKCTAGTFIMLFCGHKLKITCNEYIKAQKHIEKLTDSCPQEVTLTASCGHTVTLACHKTKHANKLNMICAEMCVAMAPCGHNVRIRCSSKTNENLLRRACNERCSQELICKHRCEGTCRDCWPGLYHVPCQQKCNRILLCGHQCPSTCHTQCSPCRVCEPHLCLHGRKENVPCMVTEEQPHACSKKALHRCSHMNACEAATCSDCFCRCDHSCQIPIKCMTKKQRNNRRRPKCGNEHVCVGLCGEPCPSLCRICDKAKLNRIALSARVELDKARFIQLPCEHIFEVGWLDQWMDERIFQIYATQDLAFPKCPSSSCNVQLRYVHRYNRVLAPLRQAMTTALTYVFGNLAMNKASLLNLFQHVEDSSSMNNALKKDLLTRIMSSANIPSAYTVAYLDTLVKVIEWGSERLPPRILQQVLRSRNCDYEFLLNVTRYVQPDDMVPFTLDPPADRLDHYGVCRRNHVFSKGLHEYCPQCPLPAAQEEDIRGTVDQI